MGNAVESESCLLTNLIVLLHLLSQCISDLSKQFNLGWLPHLPARCRYTFPFCFISNLQCVKAWVAHVKIVNNCQLLADQEPCELGL